MRDGGSRHAPASLESGLAEPLLWAGFRPLSPSEAHAGPFVQPANERGFVRLDSTRFNIAFITALDGETEIVRFLDRQERHNWGYDLNLAEHAHHTEIIHDLHLVISRDEPLLAAELACLGYARHARSWLSCERDCLVPALGADFTAPIYPCRGWVPLPGNNGEFAVAEQVSGFCSTVIPAGAQSVRDSRGYAFIHGGYPQRAITRQRIVAIVDPGSPPARLVALVESALALTYGAV